MHPKGNLGLLAVSAEVPLTDQQAYYEAFVKGIQRFTFHGKHDGETIPCEGS